MSGIRFRALIPVHREIDPRGYKYIYGSLIRWTKGGGLCLKDPVNGEVWVHRTQLLIGRFHTGSYSDDEKYQHD